MDHLSAPPPHTTDVDAVRRRLLKAGVYIAPAILGTVLLTQNAYASGPSGDPGKQDDKEKKPKKTKGN